MPDVPMLWSRWMAHVGGIFAPGVRLCQVPKSAPTPIQLGRAQDGAREGEFGERRRREARPELTSQTNLGAGCTVLKGRLPGRDQLS